MNSSSNSICIGLSTRQVFRVKHPTHSETTKPTDECTQIDSATPVPPCYWGKPADEQEIITSLSRLSLPSTQKHPGKRKRTSVPWSSVKKNKLESSTERVMRLELVDCEDQPESFRCFDENFDSEALNWPELDADCPTDQEQVDYTEATLLADLCHSINTYWLQ